MKTLIKSIAATALICASTSSFAIDSSTVPAANRLFISGATATNTALFQLPLLTTGGLCAVGTTDVYLGTNLFMIACTGAAGTDVAGLPIVISKESRGGSGNGTGVVARGDTLVFLDPDAPSCASSTTIAATSVLQSYTENSGCTGEVSNVVPKVGIADVEAALFLDSDAGTIAALSPSPLFQILFAAAVSENLYRALQTSQGLPTDDAEANTPNLTRGQLHALYAGFITNWQDFQTESGDVFATGATAPSSGLPLVFVCRRGQTSGTQASFASFVLNERCNASVPAFRAPTAGNSQSGSAYDRNNATFANALVFAGSSSGDVRACLDHRNDQGRYAIGVLSTNTDYERADGSRDFRFVGLDGVPATLQNVANGGYHFVTENVLNTAVAATLTTVEEDIRDFIVDNIGLPDIIAALNVSEQNLAGDTGILGTPGLTAATLPNDPVVTEADMRLRPISSFTRSLPSANNCQPQSAVADAQVLGGFQ